MRLNSFRLLSIVCVVVFGFNICGLLLIADSLAGYIAFMFLAWLIGPVMFTYTSLLAHEENSFELSQATNKRSLDMSEESLYRLRQAYLSKDHKAFDVADSEYKRFQGKAEEYREKIYACWKDHISYPRQNKIREEFDAFLDKEEQELQCSE